MHMANLEPFDSADKQSEVVTALRRVFWQLGAVEVQSGQDGKGRSKMVYIGRAVLPRLRQVLAVLFSCTISRGNVDL